MCEQSTGGVGGVSVHEHAEVLSSPANLCQRSSSGIGWLLALAWTMAASNAIGQPVMTTLAGSEYSLPANGITNAAAHLPHVDWGNGAFDRNENFYLPLIGKHAVVKIGAGGRTELLAGSGIAGYNGDGGNATSASLFNPRGVATDSKGSVYIADTLNSLLRRVTSAGRIDTIAGRGSQTVTAAGVRALTGQLTGVRAVAVDAADNLYVVAGGGRAVVRIDSDLQTARLIAGSIAQAGRTPYNQSALNVRFSGQLTSVCVDGGGNLYVSDFGNSVIVKITPGGQAQPLIENRPEVGAIEYMSCDRAGNVYFSSYFQACIFRVDTAGAVTIYAGSPAIQGTPVEGTPRLQARFGNLLRVAVDSNGRVVICDARNFRVWAVDSAGTMRLVAGSRFGYTGNEGPAKGAQLGRPGWVTSGAGRTVYFTDESSRALFEVDEAGTLRQFAGTQQLTPDSRDGLPALQTGFSRPQGLVADGAGNIYVGSEDCSIRRIDAARIVRIFAGLPGICGTTVEGAPASQARFGQIRGLALDGDGNLYAADSGNHKVWRISAAGTVRTVAGNGENGRAAGGTVANTVPLASPYGVAVGSNGDVFVSEEGNNRIVRIDTGGRLQVFAGSGARGTSGDGGPAALATFAGVGGVAADGAGNVFLVDWDAQRVRVVGSDGVIRPFAGNGSYTYDGDGRAPAQSAIARAGDVAVTRDGWVLIADSDNGRVRAVLPSPPPVRLGRSAARIELPAGETLNRSEAEVRSDVAGVGFTTSIRYAGGGASWLKVTPDRGTLPVQLSFDIDTKGLPAGEYSANVLITTPNGSPRESVLPVSILVPSQSGTALQIPLSRLTLTAPAGGQADATLPLSNRSAEPMSIRVETDGIPGLTVVPAQVVLLAGGSSVLRVEVSSGELPVGTYSGRLRLRASGATADSEIPISFTVSGQRSRFVLSQSGMTLETTPGGVDQQTLYVLAESTEGVAWTGKATTSAGGNWLRISRSEGTAALGSPDGGAVTVETDSTGLSPGEYYGRVDFAEKGVPGNRQFSTILLRVLAEGERRGVTISPAALLFFAGVGVEAQPQEVVLKEDRTRATAFSTAPLTFDGAQWLEYLPSAGTVTQQSSTRVTVLPRTRGLGAGTYRGSVNLLLDDGQTRTLPILMILAPGLTANGKRGERATSRCGADNLVHQVSSPRPNFRVTIGEAVKFSARVVDGCGNLHEPEATGSAAVAVAIGNGQTVELRHVGAGVWEGSWTPASANASQRLTFTSVYRRGAQFQLGVELVSGAVLASARPALASESVTDAASFVNGAPVGPGTLVSVFGANLGGNEQSASQFPLPAQIGDTQLLLDDVPVPLLYVGPNQINAQIPYGIEVDRSYQLTLARTGKQTSPQTVVISRARPGIFTVNQTGRGQGQIYRVSGATSALADVQNPARSGESLVVYANGLGNTSPAQTAGTAAPLDRLTPLASPARMTIGGVEAQVLFAGLTPGFVGLYQVNAVVPAGIAAGSEVPVVLTVAGQSSVPVTMAIER